MAFCTKCGVVMHKDDIEAHVCAEEDLPQKGTPKRHT